MFNLMVQTFDYLQQYQNVRENLLSPPSRWRNVPCGRNSVDIGKADKTEGYVRTERNILDKVV